MTFEALYKQAIEVLSKLAEENKVRSPDETICVICSKTGKIYSGVSRSDASGHIPAERVALGSMVMSGETVIDTLVLINSTSRMAILPGKDSVNYFFTVNAENVNGRALRNNQEIPFTQIGDASLVAPAAAAAAPAAEPEKKAAPKNLLLDKVSSLMEGVDDDDEDDEEFLEELDKGKKKKKRFGLF